MHTGDDPEDAVSYSIYEAIDHAYQHGFSVLAITCHNLYAWREEYAKYAEDKGILLIPGIEATISEVVGGRGAHVLLLGVDGEVEKVKTFADLREYRRTHNDLLVIAPHPYFYGSFSLHDYFLKHIDLFDAVEHSWFYSHFFNRNKKALAVASEHKLPVVATSDTHFLHFMHEEFSMIDADGKTWPDIKKAILEHKVEAVTRPRRVWQELIIPQAAFSLKSIYKRLLNKRKGRKGEVLVVETAGVKTL